MWRKYRKTVFGTLAFLSFFMMLGTVGSMDLDLIPVAEGAIRSFLYLGLCAFFTWKAGAFYWQQEERRNHGGSENQFRANDKT